jgi:hypothetical protein
MFAKSVVESARFLKMPVSSQNLYFHLGMNADDDGVVEGYSVLNLVKANEDDLRVLMSRGFVKVLNDDLVTYISDWRLQNKIRPDRKKDSRYKELLLQMEPGVELLERRERSDVRKRSGPSMDSDLSAQCSVVEVSIGKDSIGECSDVPDDDTQIIKYQLDREYLSVSEYEDLVTKYSRSVVDGVIKRIIEKPYHGCLNSMRISEWCAEQTKAAYVPAVSSPRSDRSDQLRKLASERR